MEEAITFNWRQELCNWELMLVDISSLNFNGREVMMMTTIRPALIRQAAKLLDAIPDSNDPFLEVTFNDAGRMIEIYSMPDGEERVIAHVDYAK